MTFFFFIISAEFFLAVMLYYLLSNIQQLCVQEDVWLSWTLFLCLSFFKKYLSDYYILQAIFHLGIIQVRSLLDSLLHIFILTHGKEKEGIQVKWICILEVTYRVHPPQFCSYPLAQPQSHGLISFVQKRQRDHFSTEYPYTT